MILVVDASVACKWFIEEDGAEAAEALLDERFTLLAPDLIIPEFCNLAWRKSRRGEIGREQAASMIEDLPNLIAAFVPSTQLAMRAWHIADDLSHPAHDCFYLALAELHDTRVVSSDRRLIARLAGTRWSTLAVGLAEALTDR